MPVETPCPAVFQRICLLPGTPSWFQVLRDGNTATVRIEGEIGISSQSADDCVSQIGDAETVKLIINSTGGCSLCAFKIADAIRGRCEVSEIFGSCFSAAVTIALAADKIRISKRAHLMIHPARSFSFGTFDELLLDCASLARLNARYHWQLLNRVRDDVLVQKWLSGGDFYFTAAEAVAVGVADEIFDLPTPVAIGAPGTIPEPEKTEDEILFDSFLRGFGRLQVADKGKFFQRMSVWFNQNIS